MGGISRGSVSIRGLATKDEAIRIDKSTHVLTGIKFIHSEIHNGRTFTAYSGSSDLDTTTMDITFVTSDSAKYIHMFVNADSTGASKVEIWEDATVSDNGIEVASVNSRRVGIPKISTIQSTHASRTAGSYVRDPTINDVGTLLYRQYMGTGKDKAGGESQEENELILNSDTTYLFRFQSLAVDVVSHLQLHWYENTDLEVIT